MALTKNEIALLKALLKTATFSINRDCEIEGKVRLSREDENKVILDFTVSDDPQPTNDVFGDPDHIYLELMIDRIEAHEFGPEIFFYNQKDAAVKTAKHTYRVINVRVDGAPEIFLSR